MSRPVRRSPLRSLIFRSFSVIVGRCCSSLVNILLPSVSRSLSLSYHTPGNAPSPIIPIGTRDTSIMVWSTLSMGWLVRNQPRLTSLRLGKSSGHPPTVMVSPRIWVAIPSTRHQGAISVGRELTTPRKVSASPIPARGRPLRIGSTESSPITIRKIQSPSRCTLVHTQESTPATSTPRREWVAFLCPPENFSTREEIPLVSIPPDREILDLG